MVTSKAVVHRMRNATTAVTRMDSLLPLTRRGDEPLPGIDERLPAPLGTAEDERTLDGAVVQTLERDVEWFRPSESLAEVSPDHPPTPRVAGIYEDVRGLLWVHTLTADRRWPDAVRALNGVDGKLRYYVDSRDIYLDSRVEVIDPQTGRLVATAKWDWELPMFTPGTFISRVLKGPAGWNVGEVWRVSFRGFYERTTGGNQH